MSQRVVVTVLLGAAVAAAGGCRGPSSAGTTAGSTSRDPIVVGSSSGPAASGSEAPTSSPPGARLAGTVTERLDAGNYTYLRLQGEGQPLWAAIPRCDVAVGQAMVVERAMNIDRYHDPILDRDFGTVYFGVPVGAHCREAARQPLLPVALPTSIRVTKATGPQAFRIAEIVQRAGQLQGKTVRLRAVVVKVSPDILGRTWLHLQDGSGAAEGEPLDLLVTTSELVRVGAVVQVTGTVAVDRSFGVGAPFPLLVEASSVDPVTGA